VKLYIDSSSQLADCLFGAIFALVLPVLIASLGGISSNSSSDFVLY
jgi:hypothetical protein